MENLKMYSESFKFKFEKFLTGCDAIEELEQWDKEENGEMDAFYANDLVSIVLRLIAADGNFAEQETEYINNIFGFDYSTEELKEIYRTCAEGIESIFDSEFQSGFTYLKSINEKLAAAYKELIDLICDIVIASDGVIDGAETQLAQKIKSITV